MPPRKSSQIRTSPVTTGDGNRKVRRYAPPRSRPVGVSSPVPSRGSSNPLPFSSKKA